MKSGKKSTGEPCAQLDSSPSTEAERLFEALSKLDSKTKFQEIYLIESKNPAVTNFFERFPIFLNSPTAPDIDSSVPTYGKALHLAAMRGDIEMVKILLKYGANVNSIDNVDDPHFLTSHDSALHKAAKYGRAHVARLLLEHGADWNLRNRNSETPAMIAANNADPDVLKVFLEKGLNPNDESQRDPHSKRTLLHLAVYRIRQDSKPEEQKKIIDVTRLLLGHGADAKSTDSLGNSPLHFAAQWPYATEWGVELVKLLFEKEANFNLPNNYGRTPLYNAAEYGTPEVVQALIDRGAKAVWSDEKGTTPLEVAKKNSHPAVRQIIRRALVH